MLLPLLLVALTGTGAAHPWFPSAAAPLRLTTGRGSETLLARGLRAACSHTARWWVARECAVDVRVVGAGACGVRTYPAFYDELRAAWLLRTRLPPVCQQHIIMRTKTKKKKRRRRRERQKTK